MEISVYQQDNINNESIGDPDISFAEENRKIIVDAHEEFDTYFMGIFGIKNMEVNTDAAAVRGPVSGLSGLRPFGIDVDTWNDYESLTEGGTLPVTLELGPGDGTQGNYNLVDLDSSGKDGVNENILEGCEEEYSIGDIIYTETGIGVGPVKDGVDEITDEASDYYPDYYNDDYDGYIICPIIQPLDADDNPIDWSEMTGKWKTEIVDFAVVEIDSYKIAGKSVKGTIVNYYDDVIVNGEVDLNAPDFGVFAINLVE